jgi:hypothetical protein
MIVFAMVAAKCNLPYLFRFWANSGVWRDAEAEELLPVAKAAKWINGRPDR